MDLQGRSPRSDIGRRYLAEQRAVSRVLPETCELWKDPFGDTLPAGLPFTPWQNLHRWLVDPERGH